MVDDLIKSLGPLRFVRVIMLVRELLIEISIGVDIEDISLVQ